MRLRRLPIGWWRVGCRSGHRRSSEHRAGRDHDYDELVIVADGDDVFFLEGYGPIRRPIAAKAITELRAIAKL